MKVARWSYSLVLAAILSIGLVAVACGGSDDDGSAAAIAALESRVAAAEGSAAAASAAAAAAAPVVDTRTFRWTASSELAPSDDKVILWKKFSRLVNERTNGRMVIDVIPGGALGFAEEDKLELTANGTVDITEVMAAFAEGIEPFIKVIILPFLVDNWYQAEIQQEVMTPYIKAKFLEKWDVIPLVQSRFPSQDFFCSDPIYSKEDLKGMKMWAWSGTMETIYTVLGATPTFMPVVEVPVAHATGALDCDIDGLITYTSLNMWEQTPYMYQLDAVIGSNIWLMVNGESWRDLPTDIRATMLEISHELERGELDNVQQIEKAVETNWIIQGGTIEESPADIKPFLSAELKYLWAEYRESDIEWGSDVMLDEIMAAIGKSY